MRLELEDFKTGWFGLHIGLRPSEIDKMIGSLQYLRDSDVEHRHFHISPSNFEGPTPAIGDIEFFVLPEDETGNATL